MHLKRVVLFIPSMACGGAQRVVAHLAAHWVRCGREVTVITLAPRDEDFYRLHGEIRRICLHQAASSGSMRSGLLANLRRILQLRRAIRRTEPQIVIAITNTASVLLAFAALGIPGLLTIGTEHIHPPSEPMSRIWTFLRRFGYGLLDAVVALSTEGGEWIRRHTSARRVPVIPNPVVLPLPRQSPILAPADIVPSGKRILLAAGRLVPQKGFDSLIESFAKLAKQHPDWCLVILGEGRSRPMLEDQIKASGLEGRVLMPGSAGNIYDWYEQSNLYVLSSRFEGFPVTLTEALAHGLPVVSFDCDTGPRDIIHHDADGLLVPAGDADGLAAALDRLMRDDSLRAKFSANAVKIRERYSLDKVATMWEQLFLKLQPSIKPPS